MTVADNYVIETFDETGKLSSFDVKCPETFNFAYDVVDAIADETPQKRALVWCNTENEERCFSFADIRDKSNQIANVLTAADIQKGDHIMVSLKKHYEYWFVAIACHKLGAVMIPVTHMLTVKDFVYRFSMAPVKAVICTWQDEVPQKVLQALKESELSIPVWCVKDVFGTHNLTEAMEKASTQFERVETLATDPMLMYFTSGTTGYPKGVVHDFSYPLGQIFTARHWQKVEEDGLHFTVAETGWAKASYGKLYGQWFMGCAVMVYDFDNFDPKQLTSIINTYGVTSFCAPPTVYRYLVRKGIAEMPTLKHASTAGEKLAPEVFRKFYERTGLILCEGYGQTETTILMGNFDAQSSVAGSLGVPSPFYNIAVVDKQGNPVQDGEVGEIVVIPPASGKQIGIFTAYLNNEEQYNYVWRGGVYHTGDSAYRDEQGIYWFNGRFDDIIKTGGFRVGPYEVENVLMEHPAVVECSVIGVPDKARGQAIKAIILLGQGYVANHNLELEIREFCNQRLAEYKWIRLIEFVDEMPKTISGKIQKSVQRKQNEKD